MNVPARMAPETHLSANHPRRPASAALMPLAEAVARLTGAIVPVAVRAVPLGAAVGRITAGDIASGRNHPAHPTALRDGWAARAEDVFGASPSTPILPIHGPTWVESGAPMPDGTDVVLPPEALEGRTVVADAPAREGMRAAGEEIGAGACLIAAGFRITPRHRLACAAAGHVAVPVRIPRLRLVVTGGHEPDGLPALVAAMAEADGAAVTDILTVASGPEAIAAALDAPDADAVLLLGGTGFGRDDHSADGLARAGSVQVHGIALKPGSTAGFGTVQGRPVLLLPGRPDAALAAYMTLGRPLVAALAGARPVATPRVPLLRKVVSVIGLSEIIFARREREGLRPLGGADLPLRSLIEADAAILVAPEAEGHSAGTPVETLLL